MLSTDTSAGERSDKLFDLGATLSEVSAFFAEPRSEDEWLLSCLVLIKQDRLGKSAERSRVRSISKKRRLALDPVYRLENSMRSRLWAALKGKTKGVILSRLEFTIDELRHHLESKFQEGMTWANYGKWHVDHIQPCAAFDQSVPDQFKKCWSLENLQPLWASENVRKGGRRGSPQR